MRIKAFELRRHLEGDKKRLDQNAPKNCPSIQTTVEPLGCDDQLYVDH